MSDAGPLVRAAHPGEVDEISRLIITTLFRSNAADYPQNVLQRIAEVNAPARILANMAIRDTLVAVAPDGTMIGTAGLEANWIKSFFVHPDWQGKGVGRALFAHSLGILRGRAVRTVRLQSSLTALGFYEAAGFRALREIVDGEDRKILMELDLV